VPRSVVVRLRDGTLQLTLPEGFVDVLVDVFDDLASFLDAPPPGAVTDRLFPTAYLDPTEEAAEREWQAAVHDDLARGRAEGARTLIEQLRAARRRAGAVEVHVAGDDAEILWLTVLNDARLAMGTSLGVEAERDLEFPPDDPRAGLVEVYDALTALQFELVEALSAALPEGEPDGDDAF